MFESIKSALESAKTKQGSGVNYKNLLSIAQPGTYLVRLLPNIKNPAETFLHYFHHGWNSIETGQYGGVVSPSTWGDRCIVSELYFKIIRNAASSPEEVARAKELLKRKENWYAKIYVINDPINSENNGQVKALRFGKQLDKIITAAISGDDASEFGAKIFDLSEKGCTLRIKCESVSDKPGAPKYPTYTASKFLSPSGIDGMTPAKIEEIYADPLDLQAFIEHKTADEIKKFIDVHYFGNQAQAVAVKVAPVVEEEDDIPYTEPVANKPVVENKAPAKADTPGDAKIKSLLDGLDNL